MNINIDISQLLPLIKAFYELSGIKIAIFDNYFTKILEYPEKEGAFCTMLEQRPKLRQKCNECSARLCRSCALSKQPDIFKCHAGLTEVAAPLIDNGIIIGYVMYGQITTDANREHFLSDVMVHCKDYHLPHEEMLENLKSVRYYTDTQLASTLEIINALISYILLKRLVFVSQKPLELQLMEYIEKNLASDLSIPALCREFAVSKSELYNCAKTYIPDGIAKYVRWRRMEAAKDKILKDREKPLWKIAEEVGFDNYDYFLRLFKAQTGISAGGLQKGKMPDT